MKKRFKAKKRTKGKKMKIFFCVFLFVLGIYLSFKIINSSSIKVSDKQFVKLLLEDNNLTKEESTKEKVGAFLTETLSTPILFLENNYDNVASVLKENSNNQQNQQKSEQKPLIYIYNSHQTEEYKSSSYAEFSVSPTVMMNNYILEKIFNNNNYKTLVEESSITEILRENNWKYSSSYKASRILMEKAKKDNPSLIYFIDVHRDSLPKEKTTVVINGKSYAKTLFLIGLENPDYKENLNFTILIDNKLKERYPGISKGIYKKGGAGVNGVYNQDFSNKTILLEMGGVENTTSEVLNSALAFAECFMEVIKEFETAGYN